MTQYTKFTKNLAYNEHYTTVNNSNLQKSPSMHFQSAQKPSSRAAPNVPSSLGVNPTLPKPVLVTNLNSSNIGNLMKNERIKSSALARSVTMRYNTNTKHQFENGMRGNFTNGLMQPTSATQTNHFHYPRKNSDQAVQAQTPITPQQQSLNDSVAQSKKEYLNLLSNIHRSSSIKINREKSNLSNYFSSLVANKERGLAASSTNLSSYNQNPNSISNGHLNQISQSSSTVKQNFVRKAQPFSLRNNNTNIFNSSNVSLSNDTNTNAFLYNTNANLLNSPNAYQNKKTSLSLDNVFNGIESIISSNEKEPNRFILNQKYDLNKSSTALTQNLTPTLNRKMNSTSNLTNYNNITSNNNSANNNISHAQNVLLNSATPTTNTAQDLLENNPSRTQKNNRLQRMDTEDDIDNENLRTKDLPASSRLNVNTNSSLNKQFISEENNYNGNNNGDDTMNEPEQVGIRKIEIVSKDMESRQSMRRKHHPRRSEDFYNSNTKLNKFDIMDHLDAQNVLPNGHENMNKVYQPKHGLHGFTPAKTISQNSNYHGQIQKINGNTIQLTAEKSLVEIQSNTTQSRGGAGAGVVSRPLVRTQSVLTHITRDVNDSYAYTNVQQYIEENDLMPPEKAQSIKKWVKEVNSNFDDWEKKTIEKNIEDLFL